VAPSPRSPLFPRTGAGALAWIKRPVPAFIPSLVGRATPGRVPGTGSFGFVRILYAAFPAWGRPRGLRFADLASYRSQFRFGGGFDSPTAPLRL